MKNMAGIGVMVGIVFAALCASAQTQWDLNVSADEALKKADAELNTVYKQVLASLTDAQKESLKQSQVAWIKYRDLCAKSEGAMYEGGSTQSMVVLRSNTALTTEKTARLRGMSPDGIAKAKAALPALEAQRTALQKADAEMNKVYKVYMADDPSPTVKPAQVAWLAYRDLCTKAEAALFDKETAEAVTAKCATELTQARTARLKELFMEGYSDDAVVSKP